MQKPEPIIIAPGYTDDEIYEWMKQKVKAAQDLKWVNDSKTLQAKKNGRTGPEHRQPDRSGGIKCCQNG
ncbi:hypothetical protein ERYG_05271 [Escherichia coli M114]|nr:hypothetical protein [Escherichia coli]KNA40317.1 hypothetical protein ERYG_05271 [Escherichia coli M114]